MSITKTSKAASQIESPLWTNQKLKILYDLSWLFHLLQEAQRGNFFSGLLSIWVIETLYTLMASGTIRDHMVI